MPSLAGFGVALAASVRQVQDLTQFVLPSVSYPFLGNIQIPSGLKEKKTKAD
jgi:hypothetical protein